VLDQYYSKKPKKGGTPLLSCSVSEKLPFNVIESSELLAWRAETFWTKEPETIAWIKHHVTAQKFVSHFVDIGANVGMYSLFAATLNENIRVISVEPALNNINVLRENIELNELTNRINIEINPLSDEEGQLFLVTDDLRPGASGAQLVDQKSVNSVEVNAVTGDSLITKHLVKDGILKIDIDGDEFKVLKGFKESLQNGLIRTILVECTNSNLESIKTFLFAMGYKEDLSFENIAGHSRLRRTANNKIEINRIFIKN
jgi:FkbM family methyltransferase